MHYMVYVYFSFSILIAAVIGGIRFQKVDPTYYPFIFLIWLASFNEVMSYAFGALKITTNLNNNVYVFLEATLLMWQAKKWNAFKSRPELYLTLQFGLILCWLIEALLSNGLYSLYSMFRILSGSLILIVFIGYSNRLLFQYTRPVVRDSSFLISIGLIFFFSFKILVEIYWWLGVEKSDNYLYGLYIVIAFINLFVNLLFIIAVLWIPKKAKYTTCS